MYEQASIRLGGRRWGGALAAVLVALLVSLALPKGADAAAATHFTVVAPAKATKGIQFSYTVTARDAMNAVDTTYVGPVNFSSTDGMATLSPPSSLLVSGTGTFMATLRTPPSQTITATDSANSSITGTSNAIAVSSPHFVVSAPSSARAGSAFSFTVSARDANNAVFTGYTGTVHFTSTDPSATLPADSTLTNGNGNFNATLQTEGVRTITATDTVDSTFTGTSNGIAVSTATHFAVSAPASATTGKAFNLTVTALNADGSVDTGYAGQARFTSTDDSASLPLDSTLAGGKGTFNATLRTPGVTTISVTDSGNSSVSGASAPIAVRPSNVFSFGKLTRNKQNGTATIAVDVPGPGKLTLGGKGVRPQRPLTSRLAAPARAVTAAGVVKLIIKAAGKAKKKLRRTGKAKVRIKVTFTPTGGSAALQSRTVKLKKELHA
jgi:hypothetical protein